MDITAFFTKNGSPQAGLSPTIMIWKIEDGSIVINNASMQEIAGGFYKYSFTGEINTTYAVRCDGTNILTSVERYTYNTFVYSESSCGELPKMKF